MITPIILLRKDREPQDMVASQTVDPPLHIGGPSQHHRTSKIRRLTVRRGVFADYSGAAQVVAPKQALRSLWQRRRALPGIMMTGSIRWTERYGSRGVARNNST
jgi:hypothetical protein